MTIGPLNITPVTARGPPGTTVDTVIEEAVEAAMGEAAARAIAGIARDFGAVSPAWYSLFVLLTINLLTPRWCGVVRWEP